MKKKEISQYRHRYLYIGIIQICRYITGFPGDSVVKNTSAKQETRFDL